MSRFLVALAFAVLSQQTAGNCVVTFLVERSTPWVPFAIGTGLSLACLDYLMCPALHDGFGSSDCRRRPRVISHRPNPLSPWRTGHPQLPLGYWGNFWTLLAREPEAEEKSRGTDRSSQWVGADEKKATPH